VAGLYLHIPFCEHKCIYCDFFSVDSQAELGRFLEALEREITIYGQEYGIREPVETIYFGGGTPSILPPSSSSEILKLIGDTFPVAPDAEITLEANPGTVEQEKLLAFRRAGFNRLSVGIQSFHDAHLGALTRIHTSGEALKAVSAARAAGFPNISLDLIFALPGETTEEWESDLERAVSLAPEHISAYSLIVEEGTPLARMVEEGSVRTAPEETEARMYEATMARLASAGYEHYEVSSYARPGFRSRHNMNYWNHSNYLGMGPSAHSFWSTRRWWNLRSIPAYSDALARGALPLAGGEDLTRGQLLAEAIMLGLRSDGIDLEALIRRFGVDLRRGSGELIGQLLAGGLALEESGMLRLSDKGYLVCDKIVEMLLPGAVLP